jgi:hypothetical protein
MRGRPCADRGDWTHNGATDLAVALLLHRHGPDLCPCRCSVLSAVIEVRSDTDLRGVQLVNIDEIRGSAGGLCCTNRVLSGLPLPPDGLILLAR